MTNNAKGEKGTEFGVINVLALLSQLKEQETAFS